MSRIPRNEPRIDLDVKDSKPGADVPTVVHLDNNRRSHGTACKGMVLTAGCELHGTRRSPICEQRACPSAGEHLKFG
jgi:hypothetical protein